MSEAPDFVRSCDRLIETAVRPLSDNAELQIAALGFLGSLKISDAGAEAAVSRWEALDARRRPLWRIGLWVMLVAVSLVVWFWGTKDLIIYSQWAVWARGPFSETVPNPTDRVARELDDGQKLLLFGDFNQEAPHRRKEALWQSEPENPAYFVEYAVMCFRETGELPRGFLKTARRIDPENAWFTYFAAAVEAKESVKQKPSGTGALDALRGWKIVDSVRMDRALDLFRSARDQPEYDDYSNEILQKRLRLLPQESLDEHLDSIACIAGASVTSGFETISLVNAIGAKAWTFGESGGVDEFLELSADTEVFLHRLYRGEPGTLMHELVASAMLQFSAENLVPAAEKLELESESSKWRSIRDRLAEVSEVAKSRGFFVDGKEVDPGRIGGSLFGSSYEMLNARIESPPLVTAGDLKPNRMLDHEVLSRLFGHVTWGVIGLCLAMVALYRFCVAELSRRLASRMEDLLLPLDWAWVFGGGVALPFLFVMAINRLTPLGGREFGMIGNAGLLPLAHFLGLLVLWLIVPVQVARWRLAKRGAFLNCTNPSWIAMLGMFAAIAFVPMIGWAVISGSIGDFWLAWMAKLPLVIEDSGQSRALFWWALGMLVLPISWLVISVFCTVFGGQNRLLQRVTVSMIVVKAYAFAMLLMISAVLGFKAAEQYWFERDTLMRFDSEQPSWSRFEYQLARSMRKERREILGFTP